MKTGEFNHDDVEPDATRGLSRSARVTGIARTSAFPPVVLCLRVLTKQQHNRPHSVLDWACQTLWPIQLDDDYGSSVALRPAIQPSARIECVSQSTETPLAENPGPDGGAATLSGTLFTGPLPDLQSSFGYEIQKSRFGRGGGLPAEQLLVRPTPHRLDFGPCRVCKYLIHLD